MMFDIQAPVSPMIVFVTVDGENAIYHQLVYDEDCDEFKVDKVLKFKVETWEKVDS